MEEPNVAFPTYGGPLGATTIGISSVVWALSTVLSIYADGIVNDQDWKKLDSESQKADLNHSTSIKLSLWFACAAAMANILAMTVQHAYIYIIVGPRTLLTRPNPPRSIRWHAAVLELILWAAFIAAEVTLLIGIYFYYTGSHFLTFGRGMCTVSGYICIFVIFVSIGLHKYVVQVQLGIPEENRIRSVLAAANELPLTRVTQVDEEQVCAICYETPRKGEKLRELPCPHLFHRHCIDRWLITRPVCPICNINVL